MHLISNYRVNDEPVIVSCAGCYGDEEAVLKWRREPDEVRNIIHIFLCDSFQSKCVVKIQLSIHEH